MMFVGDSGCGKTTLARICAKHLIGGDLNGFDFDEVNCAASEAMKKVRSILGIMDLRPAKGNARVWLLDEVQAFSRAKFAQEAMLKMLEDSPKHAYFLLCTTEIHRVIKTVQKRCTIINVKLLDDNAVERSVKRVAKKAGVKNLTDDVVERIVEMSEGSGRRAIKLLEDVAAIKSTKRLACLSKADDRKQAIDLARAIFSRKPWNVVKDILKNLEHDADATRKIMLAYASSIILGGGPEAGRAKMLVEGLWEPLWEIGKPGLISRCHDLVHARDK